MYELAGFTQADLLIDLCTNTVLDFSRSVPLGITGNIDHYILPAGEVISPTTSNVWTGGLVHLFLNRDSKRNHVWLA